MSPTISERILRMLKKHGGMTKDLVLAYFDGTWSPAAGETEDDTERSKASVVLDAMIAAGQVSYDGSTFCRLPAKGSKS